ncbi:MAG: hypothetical protein WC595_01825 [Candidatus Nanoarchaeia archaeon]
MEEKKFKSASAPISIFVVLFYLSILHFGLYYGSDQLNLEPALKQTAQTLVLLATLFVPLWMFLGFHYYILTNGDVKITQSFGIRFPYTIVERKGFPPLTIIPTIFAIKNIQNLEEVYLKKRFEHEFRKTPYLLITLKNNRTFALRFLNEKERTTFKKNLR